MTLAPVAVERIALAAEGLAHHYAHGRGLDPVSFDLAGPGLVAVTGPNGAGKSTLLRLLAGLLRPTAGRWSLAAAEPRAGGSGARGRAGYAASEMALYDELTAGENLEFAATALGVADGRDAVRRALAEVELAGQAETRWGAMSSGMRQRLRIAFALLTDPPLLLLDEPGSHLDARGRELLWSVLERQRARGLAVIATHDEREWRSADHRIELRPGGVGRPA